MSLLALAARNVLRNRRRSLLTAATVLVGVFASVGLRGFANGYLRAMSTMMVQANVGAVQVHAAGFKKGDKRLLELDLPATPEFLARVTSVQGVKAVAPRLLLEGMLNNGRANTMVQVAAFSPLAEAEVCPDRFAGGRSTAPLLQGDEGKALLGKSLATALQTEAGANLTLLTSTRHGGANALDLSMKGVFTTPNPLESKRMVAVTLAFAQELTGLEGRANELAVSIHNIDDADLVADRLQNALGPEFEVVTWRQRMPVVGEVIARMGSIFAVVYLVLFVLILSGILNTMLMSVYERVPEIGTMMAVGIRRRQVMRLFLMESALLGGAGGVAGAVVGAVVLALLNVNGIIFTPPGSSATIQILPFVAPQYFALSLGVAVAGAVVAAVLPAVRAAQLSPVEALRPV